MYIANILITLSFVRLNATNSPMDGCMLQLNMSMDVHQLELIDTHTYTNTQKTDLDRTRSLMFVKKADHEQ